MLLLTSEFGSDFRSPFPHSICTLGRTIIEKDLGRPLESVFSSVDEVPLATASIAQVHRAVHRDSGKDVVIKVGIVLRL